MTGVARAGARGEVTHPGPGPTDVPARFIAQRLTENLGRNFLVENHPGAQGNIAHSIASR